MNELELVNRIRRGARSAAWLTRGIGDDCAVLRAPRGAELLVTTDLFVEERHFRRGVAGAARASSARDLGYRALARALSDIAAMGGTPMAYFVSILVPQWAEKKWLDGFYRGMRMMGERSGAVLAGGDTTRGETFVCDVMVLGHAPKGRALRRDGARVGDAIYVSGELGVEARGKRVRFEPRLALGRYLLANRLATACMDVSDGLALDLHRLCVRGVGRGGGVARAAAGGERVWRRPWR